MSPSDGGESENLEIWHIDSQQLMIDFSETNALRADYADYDADWAVLAYRSATILVIVGE